MKAKINKKKVHFDNTNTEMSQERGKGGFKIVNGSKVIQHSRGSSSSGSSLSNMKGTQR